jgi:hypothetical protein
LTTTPLKSTHAKCRGSSDEAGNDLSCEAEMRVGASQVAKREGLYRYTAAAMSVAAKSLPLNSSGAFMPLASA